MDMEKLVKLYDRYLEDTEEERTVGLHNFDKEGNPLEKKVFKGSFDDFITWYKQL